MESWLAARLDHLATLEAERGWSRPLTFTNWLTADPLEHPWSRWPDEDRVSIDAMHLRPPPRGRAASSRPTTRIPTTPTSCAGVPLGARRMPYAAYLRALRAPPRRSGGDGHRVRRAERRSARRTAARSAATRATTPSARPARIDAGCCARSSRRLRRRAAFEWTDEWFKRTWNTQDLAQPVDRRPLWHNVLTNETQFGVIAAEPGKRPVGHARRPHERVARRADQARCRVPLPARPRRQEDHLRRRRHAHARPQAATAVGDQDGPDAQRLRPAGRDGRVGLAALHPLAPVHCRRCRVPRPVPRSRHVAARLRALRRPQPRRRGGDPAPRGCCSGTPTRPRA